MAEPQLAARIEALKDLLLSGRARTQDELREQMERQGYAVNQSTVSRDLRRVGAVKAADAEGRTIYRLPLEADGAPPPSSVRSLGDLVRSVRHNGFMCVILTDPGSASLVARHIDSLRSEHVLGTIAGDDAIFVAPSRPSAVDEMVAAIESSLHAASIGAR